MIADKRWIDLGWKHPLWDVVRYYLSLRGKKLPAAFRDTLLKDKKVLVAGETEFPIAPEVCRLFSEYLNYRTAQFTATFAKLRTESEALAHCKKLRVSVSKSKTKSDHHQSSSALVASVSAITKSVCDELSEEFDIKPQTRCVWCLNNGLHVSVRNLDGAVPGLFNPKVIWEIKGAVHKHGLKIKAEKELSLIDSPADITGVIVDGDRTKLPNRQLKRLFELRAQRHLAKSNVLKRMLDSQIAGRVAQKRQVEQF